MMKRLLMGAVILSVRLVSPLEGQMEFQDLLGNEKLSQWRSPGKKENGWTLRSGILQRAQEKTGGLSTVKSYRDFELKFEWKISKGGNSGIIYRSQKGRGLEYQILDDQGHKRGKDRLHSSAALYDLVEVKPEKPVRPAAQWNTGRIIASGDHVEHWLNGEKVLSVDQGSADWDQRYEKSKYRKHGFKDFGKLSSPILIQDHGSQVWFREIYIRELKRKPQVPE
ncbi:MAG: DUF1080 domain-containing protein [Planctomycetota bacterium]|nr:DUF1080 domain-containing protein [Planctomycetota bacterium]